MDGAAAAVSTTNVTTAVCDEFGATGDDTEIVALYVPVVACTATDAGADVPLSVALSQPAGCPAA